jgi:hypothetical protein
MVPFRTGRSTNSRRFFHITRGMRSSPLCCRANSIRQEVRSLSFFFVVAVLLRCLTSDVAQKQRPRSCSVNRHRRNPVAIATILYQQLAYLGLERRDERKATTLLGRLQPPPRHHRKRPSSPALHILPPPNPAAAPPRPSITLPLPVVVRGSGAHAMAQTSAVWSRNVTSARDGAERSQSLMVPSEELDEQQPGSRVNFLV